MKKILITALACAMLTATLAGCTGEDKASSSNSSSSSVSSQSSITSESEESSDKSSESSSKLESSLSSATSSEVVSSEPSEVSGNFGIPGDDDNSEAGYEYISVPGIDIGSTAFKAEFDKNPIDATYNSEMQLAASPSKLQEIILIAADSWSNAVSTAYAQANTSFSDDNAASALRSEQDKWASSLESDIQAIRANSSDGLSNEYRIMMHYRTRTAELLEIAYTNSGSFTQPDGQANGAG